MRTRNQNWLLAGTGLLLFLAYLGWKEYSVRREGIERVRQHAAYVADALWQLQPETLTNYLLLAAQAGGYRELHIVRDDGEQFAHFSGHPLNRAERWLERVGLISALEFTAPVVHRGATIGRIDAVWWSRTIYDEFNAAIAFALGLFLLERHLRVRDGNRLLELRVDERTRELHESEARYRALSDSSLLGIVVRTGEGIEYANEAAARMAGLENPGAVKEGDPWRRFVAPEFHEELRDREERMLRGENVPVHPGWVGIRSDGTRRWIQSGSTRIDWRGRSAVLVFMIDITERKLAEERLLHERDLSNQMINSLPGVFYLFDRAGEFLRWNENLCTVTGRTGEELRQIHPREFFREADRHRIEKFIDQAFAGGQAETEAEMLNRAGEGRPFFLTGRRIELEGRPCLMGMGIDVFERKRAVEALRISEERHRITAQMTSDFVYVLRVAPSGELALEWISESFSRITGYSMDEYRSLTDPFEIIHTEDRALMAETCRRNLAGESTAIEARLITRGGRARWVIAYAQPHWSADCSRVEMIYGAAQDITARKKAEETLQRRERLLRLFVEHSPAAIAMFDRDMRYLGASNRFCSDYGLPIQNLVGRLHYEVFPEISERWKAIHQRCLGGAVEMCEEDAFQRLDGRIDWVRWEIRPWEESAGVIGGIVLFSEVVTEKKRAKDRERQLLAILEATPDFVGIADHQGRLAYVNRAGREMMGIGEKEDLTALRLRDYVSEETGNYIETVGIPAAIRDGHWHHETELVARDGREVPTSQVLLVHRDDQGRLEYVSTIARDISERRQAGEQLRVKDLAIRSAVVGICFTDLLGRVTDANPAFLRMWRIPNLEDLLGKPVMELGSDPGRVTEILAVIQRQGSWEGEEVARRLDGSPLIVQMATALIRDHDGKPVGMMGTFTDVTEARQTQDRLRESELRFRTLFDRSPAGVALIDRETHGIVECNEMTARLLGYPVSELLALRLEELGADESVAGMMRELRQLAPGSSGSFETRMRTRDGQLRDFAATTHLLELDDRQLVYTILIDITDRRRAERALRESEERFAAAFRANPAGISLTTFEADTCLDVNDAFLAIVGRPRSEIVGRTGLSVGLYSSEVQRREILATVWQRGATSSAESPIVRGDGRVVHTLRSVERVTVNGEDCLLTLLVDIGERKRVEQLLTTFARLGRELNAAKSARDAARSILDNADQLLGWDSCSLSLYSPESDRVSSVLAMDTMDGQRRECPPGYNDAPPAPIARRTIEMGAQLLLRQGPVAEDSDLVPFGDTSRRSASLMFVPIRDQQRTVGVLSIQSYRPKAYGQRELEVLQSFADHCGGALNRIRVQEALQESEERLRRAVEGGGVGLWTWIVATNELEWNEQLKRTFGLPIDAGDLTLDWFVSTIHPEDRSGVERAFRGALAEHREFHAEYRIRWPDGSDHWIEALGTGVYDEAGTPVQMRGAALEISARKASEIALRESRRMLRTVIDNIPQGVFWKDRESRYLGVNRLAARTFGFEEPEELIGRTDSEIGSLTPEEREQFVRVDREVIASGRERRGVVESATLADGSEIWLETSKLPLRDETGQVFGVLGTWQDVTERRQRELDLRLRNAVLGALADAAGELLRAAHWRDGVQSTIEALGRATGVSRVYLLELVSAVVDNEELRLQGEWSGPKVGAAFGEAVATSGGVPGSAFAEWFGELKLGNPVIARISELPPGKRALLGDRQVFSFAAFPIHVGSSWWGFVGFDDCAAERAWSEAEINALRTTAGLFSAAIERHRAAGAIRESEERLRLAIQAARQGLYDLDVRTGRVTVSPEYAQMLGYDPALFLETNEKWIERLHPDDRDQVSARFQDYLQGRIKRYQVEFRQRSRSGSWVWILSIGQIVERDAAGNPVRMLGTHTDVTRLKQAELALAESEQAMRALAGSLQQAREAERTLIAREVHDQIGQSLTGLNLDIAWAQRLLEKHRTAADFDQLMQHRLGRMSTLVDETVMSVQRLCSDLRPGILDDLGLVAALEWQADEFAEQTGIPCEVKAPKSVDGLSSDQSTVLYRIFQESLTNVVRHARATRVTVRLVRSEGSVRLEVSDDGVGMPASVRNHASSLGLLGMRERAAAVGGEVRFDSGAGKGTTVAVQLPLKS
ncbi:MAG TPA: hypothetical protein DCY13_23085 [Verrucomicrobiales bacterium]|nr:hypothetical protein [Verrucomicrobiales bacterium]